MGEVKIVDGTVCRIVGSAFVYDSKSTMFVKKKMLRTTIIDLAESGYIVNIIDKDLDLDKMFYKYEAGEGLTLTDGKGYSLNINEFGAKS